jgi:alpha-amylase/alpha-mannosidase (GH57 family)
MEHIKPLKVVLCWHMHQPQYLDLISNEFQLPWVYLHAIKDYVDMAAHLESIPQAKAVINFSPVLLEQLDEYERQISGCLKGTDPIRDMLLATLDSPVFPADNEHRAAIIKACLRSNKKHQIGRFPPYQKLVSMAEPLSHDLSYISYLSNQYLTDLVCWYHLAWLGATVQRSDKRVQALMEQGSGFTLHQRRVLLQIIGELIAQLRYRYAALAERGQIELSMSPYTHPMIPLLLDFRTAREALPDLRLPILDAYPGGRDRAVSQLQQGLEIFAQYFGIRPVGCWPSEGGVSNAALTLIGAAGFQWVATGENVLRNSITNNPTLNHDPSIHHAFIHPRSGLHLFARSDSLSDLIGFTYAEWHADDAVADLIKRLTIIADSAAAADDPVVSIILDGENAWEYYPENGYYFLSALYTRLVENPRFELSTYRDLLPARALELNDIKAGSWVFGTFSTWIGNEDKNRAWDILGDTKRVYDDVMAATDIDEHLKAKIDSQLAICEGSDWFWWFGDYNPAETVSDFERLFRLHIANLYYLLGQEPPQYLSQILSHGSGAPKLGGVIRPGTPEN